MATIEGLEIKHVEKVSMTDAIPLAARAWLELLEGGWTENTTLVGWDHQGFVAYLEGLPVGLLAYVAHDWKDAFAVEIGYVLPGYRGRGIYGALWQALVVKAQQLGKARISGITHVDNHAMQSVMARLGRRPLYIGYTFDVPVKEEEKKELD